MKRVEPFLLTPRCKDYLWGGTELKSNWNKCGGDRIAEAWELSLFPQMESVVAEGIYEGRDAKWLLENTQVFGTAVKDYEQFPLLVKLISAAQDLSVQVHPDDHYARKCGYVYGKNEMWYVLEARQGAGVLCGFKQRISRERFIQSAQSGEILSLLKFIPVKKGDCIFIKAGMVHAINGGVTLLEIQQNSDITYRIFDYNRQDSMGNKRELHLEQAADVACLDEGEEQGRLVSNGFGQQGIAQLACTKHFVADEIIGAVQYEVQNPHSFTLLTITQGVARLGQREYGQGCSVLVPAGTSASFGGEFCAVATAIRR